MKIFYAEPEPSQTFLTTWRNSVINLLQRDAFQIFAQGEIKCIEHLILSAACRVPGIVLVCISYNNTFNIPTEVCKIHFITVLEIQY